MFSKQITKLYFALRRLENERNQHCKAISSPLNPLINVIQKLATYKKKARPCSACSSQSDRSTRSNRPSFPDNIPHVVKLAPAKSTEPVKRYLSLPDKDHKGCTHAVGNAHCHEKQAGVKKTVDTQHILKKHKSESLNASAAAKSKSNIRIKLRKAPEDQVAS